MPYSIRGLFTPLAWPEAVVAAAPQPVQHAYRKMAAAADQWKTANASLTRAINELRDVDRDQQQATIVALSEGNPIPKPMRPEREAAVAQARILEKATGKLAAQAEQELAAVCAEHTQQWQASALSSAEEAHADAHRALDRAGDAIRDASALTAVVVWLATGRYTSSPGTGGINASQDLAAARAKLDAEPPGLLLKRVRARLAPPPGPKATPDGIVLDTAAMIAGVRE